MFLYSLGRTYNAILALWKLVFFATKNSKTIKAKEESGADHAIRKSADSEQKPLQ